MYFFYLRIFDNYVLQLILEEIYCFMQHINLMIANNEVKNVQENEYQQVEKQSPIGALPKRYSLKFRKMHRKTSVLESLFY